MRMLGVAEIADHIGLGRNTVQVMSARGQLPEPDQIVNGGRTKLWKESTINRWQKQRSRK